MRSFYACILIAPTLFLMSCSSSNSFEQHTAIATTQPMAPRAFLILDTPGATFSPSPWVDANGNLWLFGGYGPASGANGNLNDLWMYMP